MAIASHITSIRVKHLADEVAAMRAKSACADYRKSRFAEPTQVGFALVAAVLTAKILIPNSGYIEQPEGWSGREPLVRDVAPHPLILTNQMNCYINTRAIAIWM
ncbi:hypothetical protein H6G89_25930 [Oscillatoria sp. FACHB-1407]|uniref:hypothetical protein n=1 Tax=Oscillatoria sp. FACHB-1407 TaxID=2692847 RepID=UPI001687B4F0|nr:hypothetical protein [Oscillatoria sp. FACHB-1407]MBD2464451.1 hypothetical protein [Oscillatoria sp. FACHB-1407]